MNYRNKYLSKVYIALLSIKYILVYLVLFRFLDFRSLMNISLSKKKKKIGLEAQEILRISKKILNAMFIKSCLLRSLILRDILKLFKIRSTIIIGISKEDDFKSHCWLEVNGLDIFTDNFENIKKYKIIDRII